MRFGVGSVLTALSGLLLAAALALAGVGALNSGTVDLTETGGRLSGTFGNANELGFAAALGIPIALAYRSVGGRTGRIAIAASVLILATTIVLTFSRSAVIVAAVGTVALAVWETRGSWRRIAIVLAVAGAAALLAAGLYSFFEKERRDVSFESVPAALAGLGQRDVSGWDSRALGPIPNGPSKLLNRDRAIAVRSTRRGEGVSFRWGEADAGGRYLLRFRGKTDGDRLSFYYALGDSAQRAPAPRSAGELGGRWRRYALSWHPRLRSPHATLYVWQVGNGPSTFALSDVEVVARGPGGHRASVPIPEHLEGSIYGHLRSKAQRLEHRYVRSRVDAAHLAFRAFRSEPLRGIGWGTFPAYSAAHLSYGRLAAHDQLLDIAAELGVVGLLLLGVMIVGAVAGVRRMGSGLAQNAAIGVLAGTAVGMVFFEALTTPQLSVPIAIALAVACAGQSASTSSRISDPSLIDASETK
jgi:hypothetical protein